MTASPHQRKVASILLGTCSLVLFLILASMNAFKNFLNPATTEQIVVFTGLSAIAFVVFIAVLVLLVRNVLKLYADQSSRVMGKRLRTRMLWGAVLVSLIPIAFMFAFSYDLMNRAVDRWFSQPVTQMRDDSNRMALELAQYTAANARVEADSIATSLHPIRSTGVKGQKLGTAGVNPDSLANILQVLRRHEGTLQGGFVIVYHDGQAIAAFHLPEQSGTTAKLKPWLAERPDSSEENEGTSKVDATTEPADHSGLELSTAKDNAILLAAQRSDEPVFSLGKTDFALGASVLNTGNSVVVGLPMPYGMSETMTRLRKAADDYWKLFRSRRLIRNTYMWLLLMMTSLALFATSWLALHLSKQVTRPVEALADAMEAIAAGDYAHRVKESATEELEELVRSFNHMAADLEGSRRAVEESTVKLSRANAALEARRGELETMLQTIPNGVATLDINRKVVLANRALSEMMDPGGQRPFLGMPMSEVFPAEVNDALDRLMRRSHRMGSASGELEMTTTRNGQGNRVLNLLATVALLETGERIHLGYVVVLENATELLQAQKQSAWKEVARRVAHEIKNPLTPISLSAEQIHRHIGRMEDMLTTNEITSPSVAIIRRCSEVITSSVESMRSLVDQFAALAEFPTARPRPADLNTIVENSLAMFAGRLQNLRVIKKLGSKLPLVMADPEALKRALGNLIDNAAEAMQQSLLRELRISTSQLESGMIELTITDTGSGLTDEMRERLFLPYFSTKQRGTGLGLAIAGKIIQEHEGTIRAEKNVPAGARFILELRAASIAEITDTSPSAVTAGSAV